MFFRPARACVQEWHELTCVSVLSPPRIDPRGPSGGQVRDVLEQWQSEWSIAERQMDGVMRLWPPLAVGVQRQWQVLAYVPPILTRWSRRLMDGFWHDYFAAMGRHNDAENDELVSQQIKEMQV